MMFFRTSLFFVQSVFVPAIAVTHFCQFFDPKLKFDTVHEPVFSEKKAPEKFVKNLEKSPCRALVIFFGKICKNLKNLPIRVHRKIEKFVKTWKNLEKHSKNPAIALVIFFGKICKNLKNYVLP